MRRYYDYLHICKFFFFLARIIICPLNTFLNEQLKSNIIINYYHLEKLPLPLDMNEKEKDHKIYNLFPRIFSLNVMFELQQVV